MGGGAGLSASTTTPLLLLLLLQLLATSVTGGGLLLPLCRTDCRVIPPAWVCRVGPAPPPPSPSGVRCAVVGLIVNNYILMRNLKIFAPVRRTC